jgi:hypothetical protein
MGNPVTYMIRFEGMPPSDAGLAAENLLRSLRYSNPTFVGKRVRTDPEAMDFGSVLAVALAAPAVVELAKGIANWLARTHSSRVTIVGPDGVAIAENIGAGEAAALVQRLSERRGGR